MPTPRKPQVPLTSAGAVEVELRKLGALESPEGQLALSLARMVDLGATGATVGAAANAKQCEALLEKLRAKSAARVRTPLDELNERRKGRPAAPARRARSAQRQ